MPNNRYVKWGGVIAFLVLANIVNYLYWHWGLITVKVTDAPLGKVIKSIEWQGWVTIYTNLPPDAKVTMYVDHVPLAEAMETLAANVSGPPVGDAGGPNRPPVGGPSPSGSPGAPGAPGGNDVARGARGGGGGGRGGAQWNLAFFVAPTASQVKEEIRAFQEGAHDDDTKIYNYPTPLQMVATDSDMPAADPRAQSWTGIKPATNSAPPTAPAATATDAPAPAANPTPTVQTYLQAFAQGADIWIMAPGSWAPAVASAPPPDSSIISAVKNFVGHSRGAVTQAIVLRVGRGGARTPGSGGGGGFAGGDMQIMEDRMRNAINGLPADARGDALDQLNQEVQFYQNVKSAPPDQQPAMLRDHMTQKLAAGNNNSRRSPAKRAQRYQRAVATRLAAQGKK